MDSPENFRAQGSRIQKTRGLKDRRSLRGEPGGRTVVPAGDAEPATAELDLAVAEAEERRAREVAIGVLSELIARAVDPQIVVVVQAFGMRQQHDADGEGPETELVDCEDLAGAANRTAAMLDTELRRHDQDVRVALGFREIGEELLRVGRLLQVLRTELPFAVVVELAVAGLLDRVERLLQGLAVGGAEDGRVLDPVGDREPALGADRQRDFALLDLREQILVGIADAGEQLAQTVALLGQAFGGIAGQIAVDRTDLFVLELVGVRHVREGENGRFADTDSEVRIHEDALGVFFADIEAAEVILGRLIGGIGRNASELLNLAVGGNFLSNRRHDVISCPNRRICGVPRV
ncbi:MAG: hypothetical protein JWN64_803 [Parcubacteria group bacterium]|nr:hypothetical protein [Parcubacteria group bacterium]